MPIDGDPPYIDGYNPEEAPCPSGNWCGDPQHAARLIADPRNPAEELGCPTRLLGGTDRDFMAKDLAYAGISHAPSMQAALNQHGTELARARRKVDDLCCYHWFEYCSGRPLLDREHGPRTASRAEGTTWSSAGSTARGTAEAAEAGDAWFEDALAEHASVAAFARQTLELLALGAPPELLSRTQRAALDEIEHTRACLRLARRFAPRLGTVEPGPLPAPAAREADWARFAVDTFAEGCVGETIAALRAERACRGCDDEEVTGVLRRIAEDEARHAALAWQTLAWALQRGGAKAVAAVREAAHAFWAHASESTSEACEDATTRSEHHIYGRLSPAEQARAFAEGYREIVAPMVDTVLGATPSILVQ